MHLELSQYIFLFGKDLPTEGHFPKGSLDEVKHIFLENSCASHEGRALISKFT